jgi:hypothetical protein
MQSENTAEISAALSKAQAEMKAATFNKVNPHYKNKYADLAAVLEAIRQPLVSNSLSITQTTEVREGGLVLVTTLRHASGQWISGEYPLPMAAKPQDLGSALTYARRYSLSAIACIASDEDDDAETARAAGQVASMPKPKSPVKPQAVAAPVDPATGECSPHEITAADAVTWGGLLVAAINAAKDEAEIGDWLAKNSAGLEALEGSASKIHARIMDRIAQKRESFNQRAA